MDWAELYKKMQDGKDGHFETMVTIGKNKKAFTCRLIAVAVPEQVWAERIREGEKKLKRKARRFKHGL